MKTIIKSAIIFSAFALLSTGVFAANTSKTDTLTTDVTAAVTYYDNICGVDVNIAKATEGKSAVAIYDAEGNVLLTDEFTNDSATIQKSYLLSDLTDGSYIIAVTTNGQVVKKTISLSSDNSSEQAFAF